MRPLTGTITDPAVDRLLNPLPDRAPLTRKEKARRARSYGESPRQTRARINGFLKD